MEVQRDREEMVGRKGEDFIYAHTLMDSKP